MDFILKSLSYIFHPLFMPLTGAVFYFQNSPRFIDEKVMYSKLVSLFILTIILPIISFSLLKTLGKVESVHLKTTKERIYPLIINGIIIIIVTQSILSLTQAIELYYFFLGILISTFTCLILALAKFKASIHMISITGLFMFFVGLSIHFSININNFLALIVLLIGAIASSRLHLKAHNYKELIMGVFVGVIPQVILIPYWL